MIDLAAVGAARRTVARLGGAKAYRPLTIQEQGQLVRAVRTLRSNGV